MSEIVWTDDEIEEYIMVKNTTSPPPTLPPPSVPCQQLMKNNNKKKYKKTHQRAEAYAGKSHRGPIELIVLTIRRERQRLQRSSAASGIRCDFALGAHRRSLYGYDDHDQVDVVVMKSVAVGVVLDVPVVTHVRDHGRRPSGAAGRRVIELEVIVQVETARLPNHAGATGAVP